MQRGGACGGREAKRSFPGTKGGGDVRNDHRRPGDSWLDETDDTWIRASIFHIYDDVRGYNALVGRGQGRREL